MSRCSKGLLAPWGWDVESTRGSLGIARLDPTVGVCPAAPARAWGSQQHQDSPSTGVSVRVPWAGRSAPRGVNVVLDPRQGWGALGWWAGTLRAGDTLSMTGNVPVPSLTFSTVVIFERQMHV